jgi:Uma2 family endonuclease
MPSPFPGMDPFLEEPSQWPGVHQRLITYIADAMQPHVRPRYHVLIGERVYIAEPSQGFYPDVTLVRYPSQTPTSHRGIAVAEPDVPTVVGDNLNEAQRQPFIEIIHVSSGAVISIIELLSPSNKLGTGREEYLRKQKQILASGTHLVEIDLLRTGQHTVACPQERLPIPYHYLVCINRAGQGWAVYCIPLQRRLPRIGVPLRQPDSDLVLDLQKIFHHCYDNGGYEDFIDYRHPPTPPLEFSDAEWAELWLSEQGKR